MTHQYPREPHAGDKISAQTVRDIIRCLRRITPRPGPGCKMRFTPNGTFVEAAGGSVTSSSSGSSLPSCWSIEEVESESATAGEDPVVRKVLANRYYSIGGTLREYDGDECYVDDFVMQGELSPGETYTGSDRPYVFLRVRMTDDGEERAGDATVEGTESWNSMVQSAASADYYVKPLYKFNHDGSVAVDFRNMPQIASMEPG